jgi:hypothetical protein
MGSRRLRIAIGAGVGVGALIALSALVSGTVPAVLAVVGAIPPGVIVGIGVFLVLPAIGSRR